MRRHNVLGPSFVPSVCLTTTIAATPQEVWQVVGDFGALARWHPWVPNCSLSEDGRTRTIELGEARAVEVLEALAEFSHTYVVEESPMPVEDYRATLSVSAIEEGCRLSWAAEFIARDDSAVVQIKRFFRKGFDAIQARFD